MGASPMWGAVGLYLEPTCWNFPGPTKEGRCFSPGAKGCYSSHVCGVCTHSSPVYRTLGFHEFGIGPSGAPLDQKLKS